MKLMIFLSTLFFSYAALAQQMDIKGVDTSSEGSTTIEIKKNPKDAPAKAKWETQDGQAEINGEEGATTKDAKAAWKKACADWKKEMRDDNKENKILNLNCGNSNCSGDAGAKMCNSTGTYKIKTRVE